MQSCRLLLDFDRDGFHNMSADEVLLDSVASSDQPTLRFYTWSQPTLSLGYFQSLSARGSHGASQDCTVIRRSSGGGAILHHHELTYSFVTKIPDRVSRQAQSLYDTFHETLSEALASFGVRPQSCSVASRASGKEAPFLCFHRHAVGDLLIGESKIVGSAQRRKQNGLLQHGSILFSRSEFAPELPGYVDLSNNQVDVNELIEKWSPLLTRCLQMQLEPGHLVDHELAAITKMSRNRFKSSDWTGRR